MTDLENKNQTEGTESNEKQGISDTSIKVFKSRDEIITGEDGWLSPNGMFYPCNTTEHDEAARFLLSPNSPEYDFVTRDRLIYYNIDDPERTKLLKSGYVLVRGPVVAPANFANLSVTQLEMLNKAGILIIDPIDNSQCTPEFIIERIDNIKEKAKAILNTESYKKIDENIKRFFEELGISRENLSYKYAMSAEFRHKYSGLIDRYNNMNLQERESFNKGGSFPNSVAFETAATIEDFIKSPFEKAILITDNEKLTEDVFEILSAGFIDGIKIENGRYLWWYRTVPTPDPNIFIVIERTQYRHDGLSGFYTGAVNESVNARINTKNQIESGLTERIKRLASTPDCENLPKITREGSQRLYKI